MHLKWIWQVNKYNNINNFLEDNLKNVGVLTINSNTGSPVNIYLVEGEVIYFFF